MKKKIIALSVAFVLVAVAAIGATLSYLTEAGSVLNNFTVGNIAFDAKEYVNHTSGAGAEKDADADEVTTPYPDHKEISLKAATKQEYTYSNVLPGDNLSKKVDINNNVTGSDDSYFAVIAKVTLPDDAATLTGTEWNKIDPALTGSLPTADTATLIGIDKSTDENGNLYAFPELADNEVVYIFYYYVPQGETFSVDLSATCPISVTKSDLSTYNNTKIDVLVTAIQADGFETPAQAIAALNEAIDPIATTTHVPATPPVVDDEGEGEGE